ncbi:hypothetical protein [Streptomyces sp. SID13031]|uniref:hypothetical protein n=1 Tax=Streptomyces sp. SID13031 TaxID=2706046 RepID=UPI0013C83E06|nr:hypothetical protein [Streptomyces sp. SID13031]NEA30697.1 hypothetical protein [Streptomyces sp. SID13031]
MATGWACAVIRCERIEEDLDGSGSVVLLRVQFSLGDADPEIVGPLVAQRAEAGRLVGQVLDALFASLDGPAATSSDS